jgi:xanthine dehydrogenase accessory factor
MSDDDDLLRELLRARERRAPCALVTVAATRGSAPRAAGAKMIVYASGEITGTIGGGKFEALVIEESRAALRVKTPLLKTYPLHECSGESFGAVCGGEVTVFIEPQAMGTALYLVGGGHCSRAIAQLAAGCGWHVAVVDDRQEALVDFPARQIVTNVSPVDFIAGRQWNRDEALVIVSRNFELDREALHAALRQGGMGYLGMMGSRRKVRLVFEEMIARGVPSNMLERVSAPIGLDIGADTPAEIAVSVAAQILQVMRGASGDALKERAGSSER